MRPQKDSSISIKFDMWQRSMSDARRYMQYDPIQGQGLEPLKLEIRPFSKAISSAIYNGSWQLTTDS